MWQLKQHLWIPSCFFANPTSHSGEHREVGTWTQPFYTRREKRILWVMEVNQKKGSDRQQQYLQLLHFSTVFVQHPGTEPPRPAYFLDHPLALLLTNCFAYTCTHPCNKNNLTYFSFCVPLNVGVVDMKMNRWLKSIVANVLYITTVVPENYRIGAELGVTIPIKVDTLI